MRRHQSLGPVCCETLCHLLRVVKNSPKQSKPRQQFAVAGLLWNFLPLFKSLISKGIQGAASHRLIGIVPASAVPCGDGIECGNYEHLGDGVLRFCVSQPHADPAISIEAGRDVDTSSANRSASRRDPDSTSEKERKLHDQKSRLPDAFLVICHLLVSSGVVGQTAQHRHR